MKKQNIKEKTFSKISRLANSLMQNNYKVALAYIKQEYEKRIKPNDKNCGVF